MPTEDVLIGEFLESKYEMSSEDFEKHKAFVLKSLDKLAKPRLKEKFKRETVIAVAFSPDPQNRHRDIDPLKDYKVILDYKTHYSLEDDKKDFPSIFDNEFVFGIRTNKRTLIGRVYRRYKWNNADIIGVLQILVLCSKDDRRVILGSGLHDFMLEYKDGLYNQFLKENPDLTVETYRRITSDAFTWVITSQGMGPVKAKVMGNIVDWFQKHWQKKKWIIEIDE